VPLRAVGVFAAVVAPFSLLPMTLSGRERPHCTNGHLVLENEAHAVRWEGLSRESRLDKLLDIKDGLVEDGMRMETQDWERATMLLQETYLVPSVLTYAQDPAGR
jgi:hypothetical protein